MSGESRQLHPLMFGSPLENTLHITQPFLLKGFQKLARQFLVSPPQGSPLVRVEGALRNVLSEACLFFGSPGRGSSPPEENAR
jgi:hypothetical protein